MTTVSSGVHKDDLTVSSGNPLTVLSGGYVFATSVLSGGVATFSAGAEGFDLQVAAGGLVQGTGQLSGSTDVFGAVSGLTFAGSRTDCNVHSGGTMGNVTVESGADVFVGGSDSGSIIAQGGEEDLGSGGAVVGDTVEAGGVLVFLGGAPSNTTVMSGGALGLSGGISGSVTDAKVTSDTVVSGVTISSGGAIDAVSATVESGAVLSLASGAVGSSLVVSQGGVLLGPGELLGFNDVAGKVSGVDVEYGLQILSGGSATDVRDDGYASLDAGGTATGTLVSSGAVFSVEGSTSSAVVESGGREDLVSTAIVSDDRVKSGGTLQFGGNLSANLTLQAAITSTVILDGARLSSGAVLEVEGASVLSGATLSVGAGASAEALVVSSGATVLGPGSLSDATIFGVVSGVSAVYGFDLEGGSASNVSFSQAYASVAYGGSLLGAVLADGSTLSVYAASITEVQVSGSSNIDVGYGGVEIDTTVSSGGDDGIGYNPYNYPPRRPATMRAPLTP